MTLVAHSGLPTFDTLRREGYEILAPREARHQDIRELHIGLLNLMPDAALRATERQFFRLVGACNRIVQICIHPFTVAAEERGAEARAYIDRHYERFDDLRRDGLDALIITGANPLHDDITREGFWQPMTEVVEWAREAVSSILCSCLASHLILHQVYGVERRRREAKLWGVFSHRVLTPDHPLVRHVNTRFDAPRSHRFEVTRQQLDAAGCRVLAASDTDGVHLATSPDGLRFVFFQGHPEYDIHSLLKEHKREMQRFVDGQRGDLPPRPEHYFGAPCSARLDAYESALVAALDTGATVPSYPEAQLLPHLDNTWTDTAKAIFNNWLGQVYQLSDTGRSHPFGDRPPI